MRFIIHHPADKPDSTIRPGSNQKIIIHYTVKGHVACDAERLLTVDTKFVLLPIPVRHRMMMRQ